MKRSPEPKLPQHESDPEGRASQLEKAREAYAFDLSFMGYSLVQEVPKDAHFDAGYMANAAEHVLRLSSNAAAAKAGAHLDRALERELDAVSDKVRGWVGSGAPATLAEGRASASSGRSHNHEHPLSVADYEALYPLLPKPASMPRWRDDEFFAWQRIAGCNPILLQRLRALDDRFPLTQAVVDRSQPGESLAAALAEGRLYLVDYPMMADIPTGETDLRAKYLAAPKAAFLRTARGRLAPVAIQCAQTPGPEAPIYTPADGAAWAMAKCAVQVADANFQGIVSHLGYCHLVMESFIIAAERELAPSHPLKILLEPHFEFTLATNDVAKRSLIGPGGNTDRLQSGTIAGSTELVQRALREWPISRTGAPTFFADRGTDDLEALPEYPFRDDVLESWPALRRFAEGYVRLYYPDDAAVAGDVELAAWIRSAGAPDAGNLHQIMESGGAPATVEELADLIARVLYTCTTFHSSINYSSYDYMGYPPNMPAAAWGPGPAPGMPADEASLFAMMTPRDLSFATIELMYTILMTRNHLGKYPPLHFRDRRVTSLVEALQADLEAAETAILARNQTRLVPYTYALPSMVPASIHV